MQFAGGVVEGEGVPLTWDGTCAPVEVAVGGLAVVLGVAEGNFAVLDEGIIPAMRAAASALINAWSSGLSNTLSSSSSSSLESEVSCWR